VEKAKGKVHAVRAVLDTNIAVSALLFAHGRLAPIRLAWQANRFAPLVSRATIEELIRVLGYAKFKLSSADRDELLADYLPYCTTVMVPRKAPKVPTCRDPGDLPFLQLAAHTRAEFLVTGDKDLLDIRDKTRFAIVTAEAFMSKLEKLERSEL
jgi:putative PIN family toxin of toxin-antitoxin system